jgi:hypothetical protein
MITHANCAFVPQFLQVIEGNGVRVVIALNAV